MTSPVRTARLTDEQQSAVLALVAAAQERDGVAPMSEQSLLAARGRSGRPVEHLLAYAGDDLVGYLQVDEGEETPSAELVVAPSHRRQGVGSELLEPDPARDADLGARGPRRVGRVCGGARAGGRP